MKYDIYLKNENVSNRSIYDKITKEQNHDYLYEIILSFPNSD